MIRAIYSGISGMRNHQTRIDVIGNNIANVNTTGFKSGRVNFMDQVSQLSLAATAPGGNGQRGGVNPQQVGLGMQIASIDTVMTQGNLQTTGKVTDVAIQGDGFFILSDGPNRSYTRAGVFDFDRAGNLVNPANGLKVMGWGAQQKIDSAGEPYYEIDNAAPIGNMSIPAGAVIPPRRTTELVMKGNLDQRITTTAPTLPGDPLNYFDTSTEVYDSLGNQHFVTVRMTHQPTPASGEGTWSWQVLSSEAGTTIDNTGAVALRFGANGLLVDQTPASPPGVYDAGSADISWTLPDGTVTTTTLTPNFGNQLAASGITQFATEANAVVADQNGFTRGELTGITIDKVGIVNGIFSNGRQQLLGQMALATFSNPGGLMKEGENGFIKTTNSGDAIIRAPGNAEAGLITAGTLEMSNVDLAQQFSDMIVTQRGFQASSRVITTSDEILQELINLKR